MGVGGRFDFDNPDYRWAVRPEGRDKTMEIPKPTEDDREFFRSLVPDEPSVEVKPMFGNLGAFVNGNMFAGLFGPDVGVRLDDAGNDELAVIKGSGPSRSPTRSSLETTTQLAARLTMAPARDAGTATATPIPV